MKILLFTPRNTFSKFFEKKRKIFKNVDQIASSVNWTFKYAFYKPVPPTKEQLENFAKLVDSVKRELSLLKKKFKPVNEFKLKIVEDKLNNILEDYRNYPFSDREIFFRARLKFIQRTIRKCFIK